MGNSNPPPQQENQAPRATDLSDKMEAMKLGFETQRKSKDGEDRKIVAEQHRVNSSPGSETTDRPKHRRVTGLRLKANTPPAPNDGARRFALQARTTSSSSSTSPNDPDSTLRPSGLQSKELPKLIVSDCISEWRAFELERTPAAYLSLATTATPYTTFPAFLSAIYTAIATLSPTGSPLCEDVHLIFSNLTRHVLHHQIDPARRAGTIPKTCRFTHFVPSNILIVKIPVDCHSPAGWADLILKPVVGWAYGIGLGRELKLCGNARYVAKIRESVVEGVDFDVLAGMEGGGAAIREIQKANPGLVDGFGSLNEADAAVRPFRTRPGKYESPSVVVEASYGTDEGGVRYKACWWLELMGGEVKAVVGVHVDPEGQEVSVEVWRNEIGDIGDEGMGMVPTRVQRVTVKKREEYKGVVEGANRGHYRVEGGPLRIAFEDFFLETVVEEYGERWDFVLDDDMLAQEVADLWFGDGELVNDWVEGAFARRTGA